MTNEKGYIRPNTDICEEEGKVLLRLEMPGLEKEDIDIKVDGDKLYIEAERKIPALEGDYLLRERAHGSYRKVFTLDETVDRDKIEAAMNNGVLHLSIQLKEAVKPRKIEIR